jgi:tRNA dimethylallyltransferase
MRETFRDQDFPFRNYRKVTWILDRDDGDLEDRVRRRTSSMLANGLSEEVEALLEAGLEKNPSAARAVGYRETLLFLDGQLTKQEWEESIVAATMRLARRQRKWFRSRLPVDRELLLSVGQNASDTTAPWEVAENGERA